MKGVTILILSVFAVVLSSSFVQAACPDISARSTQELIQEIPSINQELQNCPIKLERGISLLVSHPTQFDIAMRDGTTKSYTITLANGQITGVTQGATSCKKKVSTSEFILDRILGSQDRNNAVLTYFGNKGINVEGCTFFSKASLFVAKPFGRLFASIGSSPIPTGKPDNCDETFLQGHQGYAQNQALWDSYSSDTDKVCQSQFGRGAPAPCAHTVQLSTNGNPYYLCWYNE